MLATEALRIDGHGNGRAAVVGSAASEQVSPASLGLGGCARRWDRQAQRLCCPPYGGNRTRARVAWKALDALDQVWIDWRAALPAPAQLWKHRQCIAMEWLGANAFLHNARNGVYESAAFGLQPMVEQLLQTIVHEDLKTPICDGGAPLFESSAPLVEKNTDLAPVRGDMHSRRAAANLPHNRSQDPAGQVGADRIAKPAPEQEDAKQCRRGD